MRLIDADKIEYTHAIARCIEDGHNWNELCVTKDDIEEEPTVDAVPIEWLIRQKNKHNNDGFAWIFEAVMEDWRKENETD